MKAPPNLPAVGDACRLRGRAAIGTVLSINPVNWARVSWKPSRDQVAPHICHLFELEKIDAPKP